jgi:hypothetical protein
VRRKSVYFLPFLVVFLVVFFDDFLAAFFAMALVTSFLCAQIYGQTKSQSTVFCGAPPDLRAARVRRRSICARWVARTHALALARARARTAIETRRAGRDDRRRLP